MASNRAIMPRAAVAAYQLPDTSQRRLGVLAMLRLGLGPRRSSCARHGRRYVQVMDVIVDDALAAQRNRPPEPVCVILTAAARQRVVEAADWIDADGSVVEQLQLPDQPG
jgi:hypothetical protein